MSLTPEERASAARLLHEAEQNVSPVGPLSDLFDGIDLQDAYAIQRANIAARVLAGARVVGHKVGLTSPAMRSLLKVDEPDFGHLLDDMVHPDGASLDAGRWCAPRVEPEICFRLVRPLRGPGVTVRDVMMATDAVAPALEIVDSRIRDWKITLADTVADNASSAGIVHGAWTPIADAPSLVSVRAELLVDGEIVTAGDGSEVLGNPATAVAWLANTLAAFDTRLEAGQLILPGAMTTAPFVLAGQKVEARFGGLGPVSVTFT